jgi:hypothetical protein
VVRNTHRIAEDQVVALTQTQFGAFVAALAATAYSIVYSMHVFGEQHVPHTGCTIQAEPT